MSGDIDSARRKPPSWKTTDLDGSIQRLYDWVEEQAQSVTDWYLRSKANKARWSQGLRLSAILFTAIGGLTPIVGAIVGGGHEMFINQFGYISIGLAAACVAFDKFYGSSTAWMRYMHVNLVIEGLIERLRLDWSRAMAERQDGRVDVGRCLQLLQAFMEAMHAAVEKETEDWIAEFQANIQEMQREYSQAWSSVRDEVRKQADEARRLADEARKAEAEAGKQAEQARQAAIDRSRLGAIEVSIGGANKFPDGVDVALDGIVCMQHVTGPTCGIARVSPGVHAVSLTSVADGHTRSSSAVAIVKPDETANVSVALE